MSLYTDEINVYNHTATLQGKTAFLCDLKVGGLGHLDSPVTTPFSTSTCKP